jgi:nuclear protein localization family protein 4
MQDEETLLCRVATSHDLAETYNLFSKPGWQTLEAIIQSTGEIIPTSLKRQRSPSGDVAVNESAISSPASASSPAPKNSSSSSAGRTVTGEPIAKRLAALRLSGELQDGKSRPRPVPVRGAE